ncbi:hypothetical protein FBEOM_7577 [Fusarium beomiforme]|uniref:Uncharacterized protein n=1 Tax=Fusarium beomiforme TaxID=44412 RepID=A0A9P5AH21_9HYPO|nr:hypothetical protein FBEOM_7577 [Fusarium beomiforme]
MVNVRRHVMLDIGKSRRKPSKDRQYVTLTWQAQRNNHTKRGPRRRNYDKSEALEELKVRSGTGKPCITPPLLYALAIFEKEWGEDSFSAYGFTLIMVTGKNAMSPGECLGVFSDLKTCVKSQDTAGSTNTFWFPFAFRKSAFLQHYQQMFTSPDILIPLYLRSARELESLALERSLITIQCIESRLASQNTRWATSVSVISAVLALVCYNFTNLDFDQAMVHIRGVWKVVEARGGISTLEDHEDLLLMISWVDITAALLHDTKPLFPPSISRGLFHCPSLNMLPDPLTDLLSNYSMHDEGFLAILASFGHLNALGTQLQAKLVRDGDAIWEDEEKIGTLINPTTHDLLNQRPMEHPESRAPHIILFEALRLGAIIWIIRVKRRCRSYPWTAQAYISSLLKIISHDQETGDLWSGSTGLQTARLWLLVLCSVSGACEQDHSILMKMIPGEMRRQKLTSWDQSMSNISQMPWIYIAEVPDLSAL